MIAHAAVGILLTAASENCTVVENSNVVVADCELMNIHCFVRWQAPSCAE